MLGIVSEPNQWSWIKVEEVKKRIDWWGARKGCYPLHLFDYTVPCFTTAVDIIMRIIYIHNQSEPENLWSDKF